MIWWTHPTESGLGDRLVDIVHLLALARIKGRKLCFEWPKFSIKNIDIAHRAIDILLPNVLKHIHFPPDVLFQNGDEKSECFSEGLGGGMFAAEVHKKYLWNICPLSEYELKVREVVDEFRFCDEIETFLETVPRKFVSFHIRRGDKVRDEPSDGFFIHRKDLRELDELTFRMLHLHLPYYDTFFFCGDEDRKLKPFVDYVQSYGKSVFTIPQMGKWRSTYFDLAVMTKSRAVVTSQRYSAFSRFSAIKGNCPISTVFYLCG